MCLEELFCRSLGRNHQYRIQNNIQNISIISQGCFKELKPRGTKINDGKRNKTGGFSRFLKKIRVEKIWRINSNILFFSIRTVAPGWVHVPTDGDRSIRKRFH